MDYRRVKTVCIKDLKELRKSRQAMLTTAFVPIVFIILLPAITILSASYLPDGEISEATSLQKFIKNFPDEKFPDGLDEKQKYIYAMLVHLMAPFFLVIPVMVASVVAANSFAGEKERKTLEGLLYTPITDKELITSKILVAFAAAISVSWMCFFIYSVLVNVYSMQTMGRMIFPTTTWLLLMFWLVPTLGFFALSLIVWVSEKASSVWEAQQVSSLLVLPLIGLMVAQTTGLMFMDEWIVVLAGLIAALLDVASVNWIAKNMSREKLITSM
jgi:ABC-2 type transport system permease protein